MLHAAKAGASRCCTHPHPPAMNLSPTPSVTCSVQHVSSGLGQHCRHGIANVQRVPCMCPVLALWLCCFHSCTPGAPRDDGGAACWLHTCSRLAMCCHQRLSQSVCSCMDHRLHAGHVTAIVGFICPSSRHQGKPHAYIHHWRYWLYVPIQFVH